jgi:hypothetical protein
MCFHPRIPISLNHVTEYVDYLKEDEMDDLDDRGSIPGGD